MSLPYVVNWQAANTSFLGPLQSPTTGVPLLFNNPVTILNPITNSNVSFLGAINQGIMPPDNVRTVTLTSSGNLSGIQFTIISTAENGLVSTQAIAGPNADTVSYSTPPAAHVISIIPNGTSSTQLSIGISNGYTMPFECDVWNKQSLLSFAITNVVGTVSLTPQITNDKSFIMVRQGNYTPLNRMYFTMVPDQNKSTTSTDAVTIPITANTIFSFSEFPVSACRLSVGSTTTGSFTLTTIMQGGKY